MLAQMALRATCGIRAIGSPSQFYTNRSVTCFSSSREKEWEKHGTCGGCIETLNSPKKFFGAALFLHSKYNIDRVGLEDLQGPSITLLFLHNLWLMSRVNYIFFLLLAEPATSSFGKSQLEEKSDPSGGLVDGGRGGVGTQKKQWWDIGPSIQGFSTIAPLRCADVNPQHGEFWELQSTHPKTTTRHCWKAAVLDGRLEFLLLSKRVAE
ncbi:hypothetical protein L345_13677, partial [Ophiophagus hannah]